MSLPSRSDTSSGITGNLVIHASGTAAGPTQQADTSQEEGGTKQDLSSGSSWLLFQVRLRADDRPHGHDDTDSDEPGYSSIEECQRLLPYSLDRHLALQRSNEWRDQQEKHHHGKVHGRGMTEHTRGQASDSDTYDARADGGISNTWAHSASSRITLEVSPPSNRSRLARPLHPVSGMSFPAGSEIIDRRMMQ
jgi:hypothetical protein